MAESVSPSFGRLTADAGHIGAFEDLVSRRTDPADWPLADAIADNVPFYAGDAVRAAAESATARRALMDEWARCLAAGPGVIVIRGAMDDLDALDRASELFDRIIARERADGLGAGDHFAAAGANDRIWNAAQKHCLADPGNFARYYAADAIALAAEAWLGPGYQVTAQVNRVNPGGKAQVPHRDYHLGFMTTDEALRYPAHVHRLSPALTLQGAIAHCDMPVESGPTMLLPYSQQFEAGYVAFGRPEFQDVFARRHVQLPLARGDAVFFNPALMHGAGANRTEDVHRMANLLQISSAMGRAMEALDRGRMVLALYPVLRRLGLPARATANVIAAAAEGYAFPTNLDSDPPLDGLAPRTQAAIMAEALAEGLDEAAFAERIAALETRRQA